jgi:hypothetical protein
MSTDQGKDALQGAAGPALLAQIRKKGTTTPTIDNPATNSTPATTSTPTRPFDVEYDNKSNSTFIVFHTRNPNTKESNSIGTLAEHFTMVRRPHNKQSRIRIHHLYLNYNMFKYAQTSMNRYNATVTDTSSNNSSKQPNVDRTEVNLFYERRNWQELMSTIGERVIEDTIQDLPGLNALIDTLETLKEDKIAESKRNVESGTVFFDDLQFVYPSGSKVMSNHIAGPNIPMGLTVLWTQYTEGKTMFGMSVNFTIYVECWITVGKHFVPLRFQDMCFQYQNKRSISGLFFTPMNSVKKLKELEARGEIYVEKAVGQHYVRYGEQSFFPKSNKQRSSSSAASRGGGGIIVDTITASEQFCIARGSQGGSWNDMIDLAHRHYKNYLRDASSGSTTRDTKTSPSSVIKEGEGEKKENSKTNIKNKHVLTKYSSMFYEDVPISARFSCWPVLAGFSFTAKLWGVVLVNSLCSIPFDSSAFNKLVLPKSTKSLIKAVVQYGGENMNDIIRGKGEGVVFLFYGPPGVGKTLTAEAIAEMLNRPLYQVGMGELGTTPAELEKGLKNVLQMCARWDALVLLDEADIFVERRSESSGILRNAMVSVMLRMIEYFQGVLFLTTNRVETFDPAFQTRITAAIKYHPLGTDARIEVWKNLILASGHEKCLILNGGDVDPSILGTYELNGRSIKNALRLALSLAKAEAVENGDTSGETAVLRQKPLIETVEMCVQFSTDMNLI